jgi:RNA polymerase sigma factor (sigma-70 family)
MIPMPLNAPRASLTGITARVVRTKRGEPSVPDRSAESLLRAAAAGDHDAWNEIVARYHRLVWAVARSFRLDHADAADVSQTTWLRLVENVDRINDGDGLPGWLATTARRECLRLLRRTRREIPEELDSFESVAEHTADPAHGPEAVLLSSEERTKLWQAFATLTDRCQQLLRVLAVAPLPSYADVAAALGVPIGSVGPTRSRCLAHLRRAWNALYLLSDTGA